MNNKLNLYSLLYVFNTDLKNSDIILFLHRGIFIFKKINSYEFIVSKKILFLFIFIIFPKKENKFSYIILFLLFILFI